MREEGNLPKKIVFTIACMLSPLSGILNKLINDESIVPFDFALPVAAFSMLAIIFYSMYGNPLNWWVVFTGIEMKINTEQYINRGENMEELKVEIESWVKQMSKGRYYKVNPYKYLFLRKRDAAAFKLVWS